jgi:beta-phosphoglucomutase-like phosphatase (HAD superfamily)
MSFNQMQQKNDFKDLEGIIFDLDGTLLNTEKLKFRTYYDELKFNGIKLEKLEKLKNIYISLVGSTDIDVAKKIFDTYQIKSVSNNPIYKSSKPWKIFYQSILKRYYISHGNEKSLNANTFDRTLNLLKKSKSLGKKIAIATSSTHKEASRIIKIIDLEDEIDLLVTKDDIKFPKPDPEIYIKAIKKLKIKNKKSVICIEDSLIGLESAISANLLYIAVPNEFTEDNVRNSEKISSKWIVSLNDDLNQKVISRIKDIR